MGAESFEIYRLLLAVSVVLFDLHVLVGLDNLNRNRKYVVVRLHVRTMAGVTQSVGVSVAATVFVLITYAILAGTLIERIGGRGILYIFFIFFGEALAVITVEGFSISSL